MKQRIITGLIGGVGFLFLVWLGGIPYSLLILSLAAIGYYEFLKMNNINFLTKHASIGFLTVFSIIFVLNPISPYFEKISFVTVILLALWLFLVLIVIMKNTITFDQISILIIGALYIAFGFGYMLKVRLIAQGFSLTLLILIATWASDSGAYFTGKYFGKHKLWPDISPKKTIEGSIGGILFSIFFSLIVNKLLGISDQYLSIVSAGFLVAVIGQIGDLVESALKRSKGIKDSGNLLPGHGGVLDRFDSLIFVFPIFYLVYTL